MSIKRMHAYYYNYNLKYNSYTATLKHRFFSGVVFGMCEVVRFTDHDVCVTHLYS